MLGQIERGQSSPTINILWKISTGLKIPLSFFCKQEEAEYMVAGLDGENVITEENGGTRAYPLFPFDPVRNVEVFYIEFDAGVRHESLPHVPLAMAEAFRSGNLGVMDYYRMKNIEADTQMREAISKPEGKKKTDKLK